MIAFKQAFKKRKSISNRLKIFAKRNWRYIARTLSLKEKIAIFFLLLISSVALAFWLGKIYLSITKSVPTYGGNYIEGIVGQPMYINPLLSQTNETDDGLVRLIYNGLLRYDKAGNLVNDLTERYGVSEDGKEYTFYLRKDVKWHDGENFDANDVLFTINTLNDPLFKSPLRQNWKGVKTEKVDDYTVKFLLEKPYFGFLENLTLGILPEHIWGNMTPEKFPLAKYNLEPVGTGPYKYLTFHKDSEGNILDYELESFEDYFGGKPYISKVTFSFYINKQAEIDAYNRKEISGIGNLSAEDSDLSKFRKNTRIYEMSIPWSFTVFFNRTKSVALANKEVREALALATNKQQIVDDVLHGKAIVMNSPFFPGTDEYAEDISRSAFDPDKAKKLLDEKGWKTGEDGIREKDGDKLQFKILTINTPDLIKTAELLKNQWREIGAEVEVEALTFADIQQNHIRPREYDALLVGQDASFNVDPYSFWHSSQKRDPGLNWSLFDNEEADKMIEEAREEKDRVKRVEKYHKFQEIIANEVPAIFLFSPKYLYLVDGNIKGIDIERINSPQWRFADINKWFIKTKRVKK